MECNCKHTEIALGLVILVFALWQVKYSMEIVIISAVLLIIHALKCKNCNISMPEKTAKSSKKKKR